MKTMRCLCDRVVEFEGDEYQRTCECGFVLVLTEEVEAFDDEPADIDDDSCTNPYTGGHEDDGFDTGDDGCFFDE